MVWIIIIVIVIIVVSSTKGKENSTNDYETAIRREKIAKRFEEQEKRKKEIANGTRNESDERNTGYYYGVKEQNFIKGYGGTINLAIKGLVYRTNEDINTAKKLPIGSRLYLEKENNNIYDKNAHKVLTEDKHFIGYIPATHSSLISSAIKKGYELNCFLAKRTSHEIPYMYMDVSYQSELKKEKEYALEKMLESIDLKETANIRIQNVESFRHDKYANTTSIKAKHIVNRVFSITEIIATIDNEEITINYNYSQNIGRANLEKAKELEKELQIDKAIELYEKNILLGECIYKSTVRLSVLYKKVNRKNEILEMLRTAINKAKEELDYEDDINKLEERIEKLNVTLKNTLSQEKDLKIKKLKNNIENSEKAYKKALSEQKENIALNAKNRIEKYKSELEELQNKKQ